MAWILILYGKGRQPQNLKHFWHDNYIHNLRQTGQIHKEVGVVTWKVGDVIITHTHMKN